MMSVELEYMPVCTSRHTVKFYADDTELTDAVRRQVVDVARGRAAAIFIATDEHRGVFEAELAAAGVDFSAAGRDGTVQLLDAAATLELFMSGHVVDPLRFRKVIGPAIRRAVATGRSVVAYGEMVALLWEAGEVVAAVDLEHLWNDLGREFEFSLLCGYPAQSVGGEDHAAALAEVHRLHSSVVPASPTSGEEVREFALERAAPSQARAFVREVLCAWGHRGVIIDDAQLLISELTTNAVVHAGSPFRIIARPLSFGVRLSVHDASPVSPGLRDGVRGADSGHGLHLVATLSDSWGVEPDAPGKAVWAELSA
jgi:anti-sigma regulatory factor (Ser/Thr protein kinase)